MKFSIIMPTYNCERYVAKSVTSVLNQTYNDFELIIVDDYSTDGTVATCRSIIENKINVYLYTIEHGGVSKARNFGLEKARGEYVLFIDGDDHWDQKLLERVDALIEGKTGLLLFGMQRDWYLSDDTFHHSEANLGNSEKIEEFSSDTSVDKLFSAYNMSSPCNKVYKREIIEKNALTFSEKCVYLEDLKFNFDYLQHTSNIKIFRKDLYHYRLFVDQKQRLKRKFVNNFTNSDEIYHSAIAYLNSKKLTLKDSNTITGILASAYFNELLCHIYQADAKKVSSVVSEFKSNPNINNVLSSSSDKLFKLLKLMGKKFPQTQIKLINRRYK